MLLPVDQVCQGAEGEGRFKMSNADLRYMQDAHPENEQDDPIDPPELGAFGMSECEISEIGASWEGYDR